jgi:hypothetical protein
MRHDEPAAGAPARRSRWWMPDRERLARSRLLRPLARHLQDDRLWHIERGAVARAVAIGLFFGLLLPVAQFLFAVACAIWLRGHVAIAAASTFVTNPLTFAPLYWLAHRVGGALLGEERPTAAAEAANVEAAAQATAAGKGWIAAMWDTFIDAGPQLLVGLAALAVVGAVLGFVLTWVLWPRRDRPET